MKKSLTLLFLLVIANLSLAQFTVIPSGTTTTINSIDQSMGKVYFLGDAYLSKTNDLGVNLEQMVMPATLPFNYSLLVKDTMEIYFISTAYNVNLDYEIMRTQNGGASWSAVYTQSGIHISELSISENGKMLAVGFGGTTFQSQNGTSWTMMVNSISGEIHNCVSLSDDIFFIAGNSEMSRTDNFGSSWSNSTFNTTPSYTSSISVIDYNTIYISSRSSFPYESYFSKSFDGGATWTTSSMGTDISIYDMVFKSSMNGYAVGYHNVDTVGIFMETSDAGETWTTYSTGVNSQLMAIELVDREYLFMSGTNGTILKTELSLLNVQKNDLLDSDFSIYPNPGNTSSPIMIKAAKPDNYTAELLDVTGRKLSEVKFETELSLHIKTKGVHFVRITNNKSIPIIKKIIIRD